MKPRKARDLYAPVATQHGLPAEDGELIASFYWSEVRRSLTELSDVRIHLTNLGDFTVKHWRLDAEIERCRQIAQRGSLPVAQAMLERIEKLEAVRQRQQSENQRRDFIRQHKRKLYETSRTSENLEQPGRDSGRSPEPGL